MEVACYEIVQAAIVAQAYASGCLSKVLMGDHEKNSTVQAITVIDWIELASRTAQVCLQNVACRVSNRTVRSQMQQTVDRVVATINLHSVFVLSSPRDQAGVGPSLIRAAYYLSQGNWNAVAVTEPNIPPRTQKLIPLLRRALVVALCAAGAYAAPLFPYLISPSQVAYVRGVLVITAIFALISPEDALKTRESLVNTLKEARPGKQPDR